MAVVMLYFSNNTDKWTWKQTTVTSYLLFSWKFVYPRVLRGLNFYSLPPRTSKNLRNRVTLSGPQTSNPQTLNPASTPRSLPNLACPTRTVSALHLPSSENH